MKLKIESNRNSKIKYIKSLFRKKRRWEEKRYIIEGIRAVEQILDKSEKIVEIFYSEEIKQLLKGEELIKDISSRDIDLTEVSKEIFTEISNTETPQYILAIVEFKNYKVDEILESCRRLIILDGIQDPGNLGTIIRTAEAMGFEGIIALKGTADIYNPKVSRATMGVSLPIAYGLDCSDIEWKLKEKEIKIISTSPNSNKYIYEADLSGDIAIIIGNEANGIDERLMNSSDEVLKIPMYGDVESLNAAIASGMIMYESSRQKARI